MGTGRESEKIENDGQKSRNSAIQPPCLRRPPFMKRGDTGGYGETSHEVDVGTAHENGKR